MTSRNISNKYIQVLASPLDYELSSYDYYLPETSIAKRPKEIRHESKLLVYEVYSGIIHHTRFENIGQFLPSDSTFILNQSKVFKARLVGKKATGGAAEVFVLSLLKDQEGNYPVLIGANGTKKIGDVFYFNQLTATIVRKENDGTFWVKFNSSDLLKDLQSEALLPIPPYIRNGEADAQDEIQYQTIFSKDLGSVAAPTAGLHFTTELMEQLQMSGHDFSRVTLHVGAGTFLPVKTNSILEHKMHVEFYSVDDINAKNIQKSFGHLIPVGTTALRTLQSCIKEGRFVAPKSDEFHGTDIFMYPGKQIWGISGLVTNFHLPKSTLLMLVSGLIGREKTLELYEIAIKENYRFFSYGDAMLIVYK